MQRTWLPIVGVAVVGALAGLAIAGRPTTGDTFAVAPPGSTTTSTELLVPDPSTTVAVSSSTTTSTTTSSSSVPSSTVVHTTTTPALATLTTTTSTTVAETTTTTTAPPGLDRATLRLVLANATRRPGVATTNAAKMAALGYGSITIADSPENNEVSKIYFRPGFLKNAAMVATDLGTPGAQLLEVPTELGQSLTNVDDAGDVIVLLGDDAPR